MTTKCPHCGQHYDVAAAVAGQMAECPACKKQFAVLAPAAMEPVPPAKIPNYLWQSIVVTLLCCWLFGIVSIVYAAQVNSKAARGDINGAWKASRSAREWALTALMFGILLWAGVVLLFPAINCGGSLANAQALKVGNNGKNIVCAIMAANTEREAMGKSSVWPTSQSNFVDGSKRNYAIGDSETFFADLVSSEMVDGIGWGVFAGAGVGSASSEEQFRGGGYNVWSYISNVGDSFPGDTPFLFTSNLELTTQDLLDYSNGKKIDLASKLNPNAKPFGDRYVVVVSTGGAMQVIKAKWLKENPEWFFGSADFSDSDATVVAPKKQRQR